MTRLTSIPNTVPQPAADDLFYVVDVSDTSDGPDGTSGVTTTGDILRSTRWHFASRSAAQADPVPASATRITVAGLGYVADGGGTALTTSDGRTWSPEGNCTYEHWGAQGGGNDDTAAIRATHDWAIKNEVPVRPLGRRYNVSGRIIDYDRVRDGNGRLNLVGDGKERTIFNVTADVDYVVKIVGDTTAYGLPHAKFWNLEAFRIQSNDSLTVNVFNLVCCGHIDFRKLTVFNCRGYVMHALEWWDSEFDVSMVRCGDDGLGSNSGGNGITPVASFVKEAVRFDYYFASAVGNSACNNIYMPKSFQIESSRHVSMYWGPGTRKCTFHGKIHGYPPQDIHQPHLILDGATQNFIIGANITECNDIAVKIINERAYLSVDNVISGCYIFADGDHCVQVESGRRNIIVGNCFDSDGSGVHLASGESNVVHSNTLRNGTQVMTTSTEFAVAPFELLGDVTLATPGTSLILTAPNGTRHELTVSNSGVLRLNGGVV